MSVVRVWSSLQFHTVYLVESSVSLLILSLGLTCTDGSILHSPITSEFFSVPLCISCSLCFIKVLFLLLST